MTTARDGKRWINHKMPESGREVDAGNESTRCPFSPRAELIARGIGMLLQRQAELGCRKRGTTTRRI